MDTDPKPWTELEAALNNAGLMLVDISRDSKHPLLRTPYSIQYLSDLRRGRRDNGLSGVPNIRVVHAIARVLGVEPDTLKPKTADDVPEAIAS